MAATDEVRKASKQFYAALNKMINGNAAALIAIWSHAAATRASGWDGGFLVGRLQVRGCH